MTTWVKSVVCDNCGKVVSKAPVTQREPKAPSGPCEDCNSSVFSLKVLPR